MPSLLKTKTELLKPRIEKGKTEQIKRNKDNAEVFTPCWIVNKQNILVDNAWFGKANLFNKENDDGSWAATEKVQDKSYYENLKELSLKDIYKVFKEDEKHIKPNYAIKHLSVFGSFAKEINRIDSDIDLLAKISLDLTSEEKRKKIDELKKHYMNKFCRFIDISEISEYLDDEFIKKIPYVKRNF